jgi:hypothetical protein
MLAKVKVYKGIEFIELNDLTPEQAVLFKGSAPKEAFIKIMIKDKIVSDCIQYKHYRAWYQQHMGGNAVPSVVRMERDLV